MKKALVAPVTQVTQVQLPALGVEDLGLLKYGLYSVRPALPESRSFQMVLEVPRCFQVFLDVSKCVQKFLEVSRCF
eukprot:jgi/Chrzof1/15263/UNPLg00657.t1